MARISELAADRLKWADEQLADCHLCPRKCRVNRLDGERGWCGAGMNARYFSEFVHYGEESDLVPSHTLYLTGCNMKCLFCHTADDRKDKPSKALTPSLLKSIVRRGRKEGARNLNILGGEPFVNLPALLKLIAAVTDLPPVVWNTNLYCSSESLQMVRGIPAVYLPDLKFGNTKCAERICGANDYWDIVRRRLKELYEEGAERIIIRHLILPGHVECCTLPVLEWIAKNIPDVQVSLKSDYLLMPAAREDADLGRFLTPAEVYKAEAVARDLGLSLAARRQAGEIRGRIRKKSPRLRSFERNTDAEIIISPSGEIYLRQPTRKMITLGKSLATGSGRKKVPK